MSYLFLTVAICTEVIGSSLLKFTNGFRRLLPTVFCLGAYGLAYYTVSLSLKTLPLNVAYATWCGAGTVLTMICGVLIYKEKISREGLFGLILLVAGILLLNLCK